MVCCFCPIFRMATSKRQNLAQSHPDVFKEEPVDLPLTTDLTELLKCPVCASPVLPPIYQCLYGHLMCDSCKNRLRACPICRSSLGNIRNIAMEKIVCTVRYKCRYSSSGCKGVFSHFLKAGHERMCDHRPLSCPCPGTSCKWVGSLELMMPHILQTHNSIVTKQGKDVSFLITDIKVPEVTNWVLMQECFGCVFIVKLYKQEINSEHRQFFCFMQLIGSRKQSEEFSYKLELNGNRRRLTWEARPKCIDDGIASSIRDQDCFIFDDKTIDQFQTAGHFEISSHISKV